MPGKFEIKTAANGQFMFNLKAANGEIILTSEMYKAKASALNGVESVKKHADADGNFERKTAANEKKFFVLKASNGQTIGKSEMYSSPSGLEKGIASVKTNAPAAAIVDLTQEDK
ncbi:MAG: YegP family protein [Lentisphaeria bacterium]|jgi:uncharacterized protein YegP (UPF0339 family)|nr:YegP family protein [Lentisphaeria bacterium]